MTYNVVYEIIPQANGFGGHRVNRPYADKTDFEKNPFPAETHRVLAEGVSDFQAKRLIGRAPDVCFVIAAIDELFDKEGNFIRTGTNLSTPVSLCIDKAGMAIVALEELRSRYGDRVDILPEVLSKMFAEPYGTGTEQHRVYSKLVNYYIIDLTRFPKKRVFCVYNQYLLL
jgi:hypothetical protein